MRVNYFLDGCGLKRHYAGDTVPYAYGDTNWKDKLPSYDGTNITCDAIGNPLSYRGWTNTWEGRQISSTTDGTNMLLFKHNTGRIRTKKTVKGTATEYFLNGSQILVQKTGSTVAWFYYDQDGMRVAMEHSGTL